MEIYYLGRKGELPTTGRDRMRSDACLPPARAIQHRTPGSVEMDWTSCGPAVSLLDSHPFARLREDGSDDRYVSRLV